MILGEREQVLRRGSHARSRRDNYNRTERNMAIKTFHQQQLDSHVGISRDTTASPKLGAQLAEILSAEPPSWFVVRPNSPVSGSNGDGENPEGSRLWTLQITPILCSWLGRTSGRGGVPMIYSVENVSVPSLLSHQTGLKLAGFAQAIWRHLR
jgi:hypothetical protein